jgi:hypothetical protein
MTQPGRDGTVYRSQSDGREPREGADTPAGSTPPPPPRVTVVAPGGGAAAPAAPGSGRPSIGGPNGGPSTGGPGAATTGASAIPIQPLPGQPATAAPPATAPSAAAAAPRTAEPDFWSTRATTTRGMIGRPVSRAALDAAAASTAGADATGLATTAIPDVTARAAEVVPDPPRNGTVYGRPQLDRSGKVLSGRMAHLHIGWHSASVSAVGLIGASGAGTGLVVGADRHGRAMPVRFFRPEPTRITLIGGDWATTVLVLRALALGANVSVWTDDPHRWWGLGERATGSPHRVSVNAEHAVLPPSTPQQPLLSITDDGSAPSPDASERRPWQTELTILRELDQRGVPAIQDSHLIITQRLGSGESALVASALRLPGFVTAPLQQIDDEMVALLGPTDPQYVRISATDVERGLAGNARR